MAFGGFSIREYTLKMRSIDVTKCWPFGGDGKEKTAKEEMEKLLPPLTYRKYRWWSDELELVRSKQVAEGSRKVREETEKPVSGAESGFVSERPDLGAGKAGWGAEEEKLLMICPVCRSFTAATVNAVNAHIDSCLAQASREERRQMRTAAAAAAAVKSKTRAPKKRSIVEIFAVAPQIKKAEVDGDGEAEEMSEEDLDSTKYVEASDTVVKRKRKHKSREEAVALARKLKLKKKKMKKKKIKKTKKNDSGAIDPTKKARLASKKVKISKLKVSSAVDFSGQRKVPLHNKRLEKEIQDTGVIRKKRPSSMKRLYSRKVMRIPKLIPEQQQNEESTFPVHSILKNRTTVISSQKPSSLGIIQGGNQTNLRRGQQSYRHVRFSGKDDILGPTENGCSCIELPQVQSIEKVFPDVMDAPSLSDNSLENDKELPSEIEALEVDGNNEDIEVGIRNGTGFLSKHENKRLADGYGHVSLTTSPSPYKRSWQDKERNSPNEFVDLNQELQNHDSSHLLGQGNLAASHSLSCVGIPRLSRSTPNRGLNHPSLETQADVNIRRVPDTGRNLLDPFADSIPRSSAICTLTNIKSSIQSSSSCLATDIEKNGRSLFMSEDTTQRTNLCVPTYQSFGHLSSRDLMSSICSSVNLKKQRAVFRDKCIDEGFVGLPLNSQGELVPLHSSGKGGYPLKKQNTTMGTSSIFPMHNFIQPKSIIDDSHAKEMHVVESALTKDSLKLFPDKAYQREDPKIPLPSRLGITGLPSTGSRELHRNDSVRGNNQSSHRLDSDLNLMNISCPGCIQYTPTQNQTGKEQVQVEENRDCGFLLPTQPTMRLMGKDVTVGIRNKEVQGFEDGKIWTDKEIITEQRPATVDSSNSSLNGIFQHELIVHPVSEKSNETVTYSLEPKRSPASQSLFQVKGLEPRSAHSYPDWQTYVTSRNGFSMISRSPGAQLQSFLHPFPSQALPSQTAKSLDPCISGTEPLKMLSQIPASAPTPSNACQHMLLNAQLKCKQSLECGTASVFHFPFSNKESGEYLQPSCSRNSSRSLPQWLINATQPKVSSLTSARLYPDISAQHHPCTMPGTNFAANLPPYSRPIISYSHNPSTSHPQMQSSSSPPSLAYPPLMPAPPGYRSASFMNTTSRNRIKIKDGKRPKPFRPKGPDHEKKSRKRPASKADDSTEATKRPHLEMQEDAGSLKGLKESVEFNYRHCNRDAAESDACKETTSVTGHCPLEIQEEHTMSSDNYFKLDGVSRSGPIKLSAGAKHILKPSQNMDQDNSRPIHSTIPFGVVNTSGIIPEFQKKSAEIYRF
ncbi:PREDICTED: uncharacterized protein LOC104608991 [Nelumbo nucifera]|uniref:Uncharacterized protein LOC104608991 n=1 Tax=Nelumbo nucifera TaxID=4432 RepID=A0A1U8B2J8_NELNU|nr:PREDICTED: uncharacterized protein LOC104608991 [Nelumbo nucifera]